MASLQLWFANDFLIRYATTRFLFVPRVFAFCVSVFVHVFKKTMQFTKKNQSSCIFLAGVLKMEKNPLKNKLWKNVNINEKSNIFVKRYHNSNFVCRKLQDDAQQNTKKKSCCMLFLLLGLRAFGNVPQSKKYLKMYEQFCFPTCFLVLQLFCCACCLLSQ